MFAYCLNNPVCNIDFSGNNAYTATEKYSVDPINYFLHGDTGSGGGYSSASSSMGAIIAGVITAMVTVVTASKSKEKEEARAEAVAITQTGNSHHQEFFPENPFEFMPQGLIRKTYVNIGEKNGGIIKWEIPGTKIAIFEWNQDFENGAHYHVMHDTWSNKHLDLNHYRAGDPVPEPWNTIFFGYKER